MQSQQQPLIDDLSHLPPLPMQMVNVCGVLTQPDQTLLQLDTSEPHMQCIDPFNIEFAACTADDIESLLMQYESYPDYKVHGPMVVEGYLAKVAAAGGASTSVPDVIAQLCVSYYYEEESVRITSAFALFKQPASHGFGAECLVQRKSDNLPLCVELMRHQYLQLHPFSAPIPALSSSNTALPNVFESCGDFMFYWNPCVLSAFETVKKAHALMAWCKR